jgi:hypothetical protein
MKITEQTITYTVLEEGDYKIKMVIADNENIRIETYKGDHNFIFDNFYTEETLDKWEGVLSLMKKAVKLARKKIDRSLINKV